MMVALKNVVQPALVFVALRFFAYRNPVVSQPVLTTSIPTMPILIIVSSVITMSGFIALTSRLS